jgi:DNA-directed RNA polymerase subunit RPC12/RpoP
MPGKPVIHFPCPHCLRQLKAAAAVVGRATACPVCGHELVVPPPPPSRVIEDTQLNGPPPLRDPPRNERE